ncbi:hypothetical protein HAALTHF_09200n [Vreelandella aquamarina]|nr:hypothetical protein HAALTHF_09200n [Halomonas axialensis]
MIYRQSWTSITAASSALCFEEMQCQAFITSVEPTALSDVWQPTTAVEMFHVKHSEQGFSQCQPDG